MGRNRKTIPMGNQFNGFIRSVLFRIFSTMTEKHRETMAQFIKFGIVGISNTLIAYLLNILVLLALRGFDLDWDFVAGNAVSFVLSVLWSFYWNNKYVFTDDGRECVWWKTLLKTYLCYGFTGIILNNILSWLWITRLGISKYIAPLINLVISMPLNFVLNKLWAFRA